MHHGSFNPQFPNTFIGGVGGLIATKSDLAAVTVGLSVDKIHLFEVDAYNNISYYVNETYNFQSSTFQDNNNVTYFFDNDSVMGFIPPTLYMNIVGPPYNFRIFCAPEVPLTVNSNPRSLFGQRNLKEVVLTTLGVSTQNSELSNTGSDVGGVNVYCNLSEKTSNGGSPDAALQLANVNPFYRINKVPPSAVTDLSITHITTSSVRLNFSMPTSTNALYKYEVWERNRFLGWINDSGNVFTGLTSATNYKFKIVTVDQYYNRSKFSNTVEVTTL